MLINFRVSNYRSVREEATLSFSKYKGSEKTETNCFNVQLLEGVQPLELLRSLAIYGKNASGKSNIVNALGCMRGIVLRSAQAGADAEIPVMPFLFDKETRDKPSSFEVEVVIDKVRYQYGFTATNEWIVEEWLYAFPKGRAQCWFYRSTDEELGEIFDFGEKLKGHRSVWEASTRRNALFLSTAVQLNSDQLKPIHDWFRDSLKFVNNNSIGASESSAKLCSAGEKENFISFLRAADFAIKDIQVSHDEIDLGEFPKHVPKELVDFLQKTTKGKKQYNVISVHDGSDEDVPLDFHYESDGTKRMFHLAGYWIEALRNGAILVVDELHEKLHPALVNFLVSSFHSPEINKNCAQLVLTTHETSILSQDIFRRDQIYFTDRSPKQETILYPLTDFSPKKGQDNLERSYLSGRYGGVPSVDGFSLELTLREFNK